MSHAGSPKSFVGQRDAVDFFNIISDPMVSPGLLDELQFPQNQKGFQTEKLAMHTWKLIWS